jgi:hypothetical protein
MQRDALAKNTMQLRYLPNGHCMNTPKIWRLREPDLFNYHVLLGHVLDPRGMHALYLTVDFANNAIKAARL